jgi:hypothetical protein
MLFYASPSDLPMMEDPRLLPRTVLSIDWAQFSGNRPSITEPTYIVREFISASLKLQMSKISIYLIFL